MTTVWRNILVYLGLVEEPEEHDEYERSRRRQANREEPRPRGRGRPASSAGGAGERVPGREPAGSGREERSWGSGRRARRPSDVAEGRGRNSQGANVRSLRSARDRTTHVRPVDAGLIRVGIVRAADFEDAEKIGERYRTGQPVLLDLGEVDSRTGRRLLDFVSGLIYALRGRIKRAGGRAFLLLPDGVDVPREERRRLADLGYHVDNKPPAEA